MYIFNLLIRWKKHKDSRSLWSVNDKLTDSEPPMQHQVKGDLILPQSIYSHPRERQQAAGDLCREVVHRSLRKTKGNHSLL